MKEGSQLIIPLNNEDNEEKLIIKSDGKNINLILMKKKQNETYNKYLVLLCKKKELSNLKELKIYRNNEHLYNINFQNKKRNIIQTKSNNTITTFVQLFCDDEIYGREEYIDSNDLEEYKENIDN